MGADLLPVLVKLVEKIKAGGYIDIGELLPDKLGTMRSISPDDHLKLTIQKVQDYISLHPRIYATIISRKHPSELQTCLVT